MPWGISEAAYNVRDIHLNYQYGPFGVPGLGLKRGLIEDLVVAPYATMLAAEIEPTRGDGKPASLEKEGAFGRYGFYESIDYTAERLPQDQKHVLIRAFMTHHQGMSLVSLAMFCRTGRMEKRFHADPSGAGNRVVVAGAYSRRCAGRASARRRSIDGPGRANAAGNRSRAFTTLPIWRRRARNCCPTALTP